MYIRSQFYPKQKTMEYFIASSASTESLMELVQSKIAEGWVPQGGITTANASKLVYAQAMIRTSNENA